MYNYNCYGANENMYMFHFEYGNDYDHIHKNVPKTIELFFFDPPIV